MPYVHAYIHTYIRVSLQECHSSLHIMRKCLHVNCYYIAKIDSLHKMHEQERKRLFVELNQGC